MVVRPENQLVLNETELKEEHTRVLTASDAVIERLRLREDDERSGARPPRGVVGILLMTRAKWKARQKAASRRR